MSISMIEQTVERLIASHVNGSHHYATRLWAPVAEAGLSLALASETAGGIGEDWTGIYPIMRAIGYHRAPLPLAETIIACQLLDYAGMPIPEGPIAVSEAKPEIVCRQSGGDLRLDGILHNVAWARHCDNLLLSLADGRMALFDLTDRYKVVITPFENHAGLPCDRIELIDASAKVTADNPLPNLAQPVLTLGAAARAIMIVGTLEWVLEQSVRYAGERVQFGKPIARNQAIQQQLALMAGDVVAARMAAIVAAADMPSISDPHAENALFSAAVAKIRCGEAATRAASIAHQVHGAIGFTHEHDLHTATGRLWAWRQEFGSDAFWAERLGQAAIASGSTGFWPALTQKNLVVA